jgi:hypothetical protein
MGPNGCGEGRGDEAEGYGSGVQRAGRSTDVWLKYVRKSEGDNEEAEVVVDDVAEKERPGVTDEQEDADVLACEGY